MTSGWRRRRDRSMRILSATLCLSALATFATSCSTPWQREPVSKVDNVILYRECRVEKDQQVELNFKHPVDVSKQKMALILSRLIHEYKPWLKSSQSRYVFTPKEVEKSSEKFAEFLGNLQPNERLRFLVSRSQWGGAISGIRATSGVFFVEREGILNVAFDRIVEAISVPQGGKPEDIPFPDDPIEYHGAGRLIPTARWSKMRVDEDGTQHSAWLEIDLDKVKPGKQPKEPDPAVSEATAAHPAAPPAPPAKPEDPYQKLKKKLETIKRLREEGVITQEQYDAQFQSIMSEF